MTTDDPKALRALVERAWDLLAEWYADLGGIADGNESTYCEDRKTACKLMDEVDRWQTDARDAGVWRDA